MCFKNIIIHITYTLYLYPYTIYGKTFKGGNFHGFSLNRECFPTIANYGLVNWQCKSTSMLEQKFSYKWEFCALTMKVFPLESFAVYGTYN